jgi:hypothetical protein
MQLPVAEIFSTASASRAAMYIIPAKKLVKRGGAAALLDQISSP